MTTTIGLLSTAAPSAAEATTVTPAAATAMCPCPRPADLAVMDTAEQLAAELQTLDHAQVEKTFLGSMIGHHQMAIEMAKVELDKGKRPALKALA